MIFRIRQRALQAELTTHLGYEKHEVKGKNSGNSRNGSTPKTVKGEFGEAEIAVPRDRAGNFEPKLIQKGQTGFDGFDDKILAMYVRGMTTRDIQGQLQELYGVEVSPTLISKEGFDQCYGRLHKTIYILDFSEQDAVENHARI